MPLKELLSEIRDELTPAMWSKAVELSRKDAITMDSAPEESYRLRVLDRGLGRAALVELWPTDLDWNSDCGCKFDPCFHIAAAAILLNQSIERGKELPKSKMSSGRIHYHFSSTTQGLSLQRFIVTDSKKVPLSFPLTTSRGTRADIDLTPTKEDLGIDMALDKVLQGIIESHSFKKMSKFLSQCKDVYLDDKPIFVSSQEVGLIATIQDQGSGVYLSGGLDPKIDKTYKNNIAVVGDTLHPVKDFKLTSGEYKILKSGKYFASTELISLSSEILPGLRAKIEIKNLGKNLPEVVYDVPRLEMNLITIGQRLQATPYIVYGNPSIARLNGDTLESLAPGKVPVRNTDKERKLKDQLARDLGLDPGQARMYYGEEAVRYLESLGSWRGDLRGNGQKNFKLHQDITPNFKIESDNFSISFTSEDDKNSSKKASTAAVFEAWQKNQSLVPLIGGGWAPLPTDWLEKYGNKVLELLHAKENRKSLPKFCAPSFIQLCQDLGQTPSRELITFKNTLENFDSIPDALLPKPFHVQLRTYQIEGFNWLSFLKKHSLGALLADDMGLGKTVQTISILEKPCLIVAPTSVIPNWQKELKKFRPNLSVNIYHGPNRAFKSNCDITITSYGLLRQDLEILKQKKFKIVVLDEAQWIKNPDSKVSQAAYQISGEFRIALSGTPVENSLEDLWSQFQFLNPGLLGTRQYFRENFIKPILDGQPGASFNLQRKIKPFLLRRLKRSVAKELPPKTEQVLYTELSDDEQSIYNALLASSKKEVVEKLNSGGSILEALEVLLRMRQACCHINLLPGQTSKTSSKLTLLIDKLETALAEGHRALVFSQWTGFLDLIGKALSQAQINYLRLDGSTVDRGAVVDKFQDPNGPPVLIMSLKAGGVGLNLSRADHVFIMDPWWNPAAEDQAADRAHRIGQENPVMIHPVVAIGTVEEKILELQEHKRKLSEAAIGSGKGALNLNRDDILALFD